MRYPCKLIAGCSRHDGHLGDCIVARQRQPRRPKAKPEAIAEAIKAGRIADGTAPGTERSPFALLRDGAAALAKHEGWKLDPDPPAGDLARLEIRTAERDRALALLSQLEAVLRRVGGFMAHDDQAALRESRALLVELGWRSPDKGKPWVDRVTSAPAAAPKRVGCDDLDSQWPGPDGKPRGPTLCILYPTCRCGRIDSGVATPDDDD